MATLDSFFVGQRVQMHPATDAWMRGNKFGEVTKVGRKLVHVKLDRLGLTLKCYPRDLVGLDGSEF